MKQDFEFLSQLVSSFFARKSVRETLSVISELEISGWEKWLQIEFAKFCKSHEDVAEWDRELRYGLDRRLSRGKASCAIDFLIRQKYKRSPLAIELKQNASPSGCIKAMTIDMAKVNKIRYSQDDLRGVWCVGVHPAKPADEIKRLVRYHADEQQLRIDSSLVLTKPIGRTGFSVTLF